MQAALAWLREGARTALLLKPRWTGLRATPLGLLALVAASLATGIATQRLMIDGAASFDRRALQFGWWGTVLALWLCFAVARRAWGLPPHPSAALLFAGLLAQGLVIELASGAAYVAALRGGAFAALPASVLAWVWYLPWWWLLLAQSLLLMRHAAPRWRFGVFGVLASSYVLAVALPPPHFWTPRTVDDGDRPARLVLDQPALEKQAELLPAALEALRPQRAGVVELYSITFAPYAPEGVFRRESALVDRVMRERFDAEGRSVQLVNHAATATELPWATPANLARAILGIANRMDRAEDILFIHLTSHGAANGLLAAELNPLSVDAVTPAGLARALDAAGVRYRVISVSACYSGSWIEPLRGDTTLIVTAADADHTSYGCGRGSELTYFGRAMYAEALAGETLSFEDAHAKARTVIERREREAGKSDGYSNPQLAAGDAIKQQLERLRQRLVPTMRAASEGTTR